MLHDIFLLPGDLCRAGMDIDSAGDVSPSRVDPSWYPVFLVSEDSILLRCNFLFLVADWMDQRRDSGAGRHLIGLILLGLDFILILKLV